MKIYNRSTNRVFTSVLLVVFSFPLTALISQAAGGEGEIKLSPAEMAEIRRKEELGKKLKATSEKAERAEKLFREALSEAQAKTDGINDKLKKLEQEIDVARKSPVVNKVELKKAVALRDQAKRSIKKFDYPDAEKKISEAFNHISRVPYVTLRVTPSLFSPDGDGVNDALKIDSEISSRKKIKSWSLTIYKKIEERETHKLVPIKTWQGEGVPDKEITWDGTWDDNRTKVDSGSSYQAVMRVADEDDGEGVSPEEGFKTDIFVEKTPRGMKIGVSSIQFAYNSAGVDEKYDQLLKDIHKFLLRYSGHYIIVEGHSDASGSPTYNHRLSRMRANAIKERILTLGFDREKILAYGLGETTPLTHEKDKMDLNRRVSFYLLKGKEDLEKYEEFYNSLDFKKNVEMKEKEEAPTTKDGGEKGKKTGPSEDGEKKEE